MVTGAGWVSAGIGYRHWLFDDKAVVDGSVGYSWRGYKAAQARVEFPAIRRSRLGFGVQYRWQDLTQVTYFGAGPDALEDDRSEYRMTSHNVVGFGTLRTTRWLSLRARAGWLYSPSLGAPTGHFRRGYPSTFDVFPNDGTLMRPDQPNFLHADLSVVADTRTRSNHPTHGGLYRVSWATFRERDAREFLFQRYEAEAVHLVPVASNRIVFTVHGWTVMTDASAGGRCPLPTSRTGRGTPP